MKKLFILIILVSPLIVSCKKDSLPEVETLSATIQDATHVTLHGNVISEGSFAITSRGFCWALKPNPSGVDNVSQDGFGPGIYSLDIEVVPDTTYFVKAYVVNSLGIEYGNEITFKTIDSFPKSFIDLRDGHRYKWIKIGNQIWMAENLAYLPAINSSSEGSEIIPNHYVQGYEGNIVSEAKTAPYYKVYGVLYNWQAAMNDCPSGWHLPTDSEWMILEKYLGMSQTDADDSNWRNSGEVGGKMREDGTSHWIGPNVGASNSSGFTALPGGHRGNGGGFYALDRSAAYFWSASVVGSSAWIRHLHSVLGNGVFRNGYLVSYGFSVRCIKD